MARKLKLGYRKKPSAKQQVDEKPSEAVADDFVAEGAPPSPPNPAPKAIAARVPPSPGKQQVNRAAGALKWAKQKAHAKALAVGDAEKRFWAAKATFKSKLDAIERATRGKTKRLTARQELNRLHLAERALQQAHLEFLYVREECALECVRARDVMIALLELKLRRMSRVRPRGRMKRGPGLASPTKRFKFGLRKKS
eukprot:641772-Prymnesium_polylepis.1